MPHLVLECSANVPDQPDLHRVLRRLHDAMAAAGFDLANVKSRAVRHEAFRARDGAPSWAFVHLEVLVLAGRETSVLRAAGEALLAVLREGFPRAAADSGCDFTVEVREMRRDLYFKAAGPPKGGAGAG